MMPGDMEGIENIGHDGPPECDFGDECEGVLKIAHKALTDIARDVETDGGSCDGDEGEPDVVRGVSCLIDRKNEELAEKDAELTRLRARIEEKDARIAALEGALGEMWDLYENGDECQEAEGGAIVGGYIGNAVKVSEELEDRILSLIPSTPRSAPEAAKPCDCGGTFHEKCFKPLGPEAA